MKKKLLLLFFLLTLTLTACTNDSSSNQSINQIILNNVVEEVNFPVTELEEDIVLPTSIDGYILTWESNSPSTLTNTGIITRPVDGDGDSTVVLTVSITSNDETIKKDFTFTVKEASVTVVDPDDNIVNCPDYEHEENGVCVADTTTDPDPDSDPDPDPDDNDYTYDGYYAGVEGLTGDILKAFLHDLIDNHTVVSYGDLRQALQNSDEDPNNPDNIILLYSGASVRSNWDSAATWNREHVWPKSLGGFKSDDAGSDMHHIRPTYTNVNSTRGNKFFDDGGSLVNQTDDCYSDGDSFEPRDEVKGDVARMMFYMVVRYEGNDGAAGSDLELVLGGTSSTSGLLGDLEVLLQWHLDDPVDDFERDRNDVIYGYQHNRNPFIDHPELVDLIWN
jgi:endonuclease I